MQIISPKGGVLMDRRVWYEYMAAADAAALLDPRQLRDYLEKRHPLGRKPHRQNREIG